MLKQLRIFSLILLVFISGCSTIRDCTRCYAVPKPPMKLIGAEGISVYPFVFIRKDYKYDRPLIEHEKVHWEEQREMGVVKWVYKYKTDRQFRLQAELRAYKVSISYGMDISVAARHLKDMYDLKITYQEALRLLVVSIISRNQI